MKPQPNVVGGFFAAIWLLIISLPVYLMLRAAFETKAAYSQAGPIGLPTTFTLDNFAYAFEIGFGKYLVNSGLITVGTVAIIFLLVPPLAFTIVRCTNPLVRQVFRLMLIGLAIPAQVVVLPVYYLIAQVGLYNSLLGVILPTAAFAIPVSTLILTGSMREISNELYEAMALDGASSWRTFWQLVVPLSRGGIATIIVFTALNAWNGFLLPLVLTRSQDVMAATIGLNLFKQNFSLNVPGLMAAIVLTIIPIFLVYIFARRTLIAGLTGVGGK
ncbi:carbohydrate ABC transporter permease [Pseudarthrobacter phenanthrenivorans]|uniref:carbohydrate ABC transporter permease n=1 Tax=Pseudarthrobacter phenanthrenivorans TaxID=361575 RepID=UPI002F34F5DD